LVVLSGAMMKTEEEIIKEHYKNIGRKGGQKTSAEKKRSSLANLEKALKKRWGKRIKIRKKAGL
jgi:hypothetical protein